MEKDLYCYFYQANDGSFRALVDGLGRFAGPTLASLKNFVIEDARVQAKAAGWETVVLSFGISKTLRATRLRCQRCSGAGQIDGQHGAAQYITVSSTVDWNQRAKETCPSCEGLGVIETGFGLPAAV